MRILFATPHLFPDVVGGSGLHSYHLVRCLAQAGHEVDVLHPFATRHFQEWSHVREITIPFGRTVFDYAGRVRTWIGHRRYDVGYSDGLSLLRYVQHRTFPCIWNDHGLREFHPQYFPGYCRTTPKSGFKELLFYWPRVWARKHMARTTDFVVSMGGDIDYIVEHMLKVPACRIWRLPNAVDASLYPNAPAKQEAADPRLFLFVGELGYRKGISLLLHSFARLQDSGARLRLVGDGPMVPRVQASGLSNVEIVGMKFGSDLMAEYREAGCFIFPTLLEGMPTALLEAMLLYKPVIASDVGAIRLLVSEQTGLLIPPNDMRALTKAIQTMMTLKQTTRDQMGVQGHSLVQTYYTWHSVAKDYLDCFQAAVSGSLPVSAG